MENIKANLVLDAKGLACPMPIVKTKKAIAGLEAGQVLEIQATDKGSKADLKAWAESTGHQYLGTIEDGTVLTHYLRKASGEDTVERKHPHVIQNDELEKKLQSGDQFVLLDVRESAEFAFSHIPNAVSIPLGELEERMNELNQDAEVYVVCRTGSRSDLAAQKLSEKGFGKVFNVLPGMTQWNGTTESITK
ncbi:MULTISPECIES: sulfurtransferase TusA family protein [unclassified Bacillus (in: firmicutes)]|uniref:sulfurtransferase TusA family protein n=1 Tax=unclassified Bacillus (in: firmicutes) TaxID=185979 RepID=UPI0008F0F7B9|nr:MULTISPECIES: sulfurtransferase TusA family protein [unclassified Bacillus (in: firmicutes)]SFA89646.1 Rhodanese-related sulfurtransferase [Bacillus sp. UNCCL13]SFQ84983.1 Rhodanese-related sulfurtransferase [Bacillus sp. cl95]